MIVQTVRKDSLVVSSVHHATAVVPVTGNKVAIRIMGENGYFDVTDENEMVYAYTDDLSAMVINLSIEDGSVHSHSNYSGEDQ